ncbi:GLUG motif-containing protein [Virgibacillus sp. DJP39]|uniref:GLUG motif-containing protein n=1 Tax=Virgibacillus sp. DJP39 TaxID=3409790 RepID=UPI003BB815D2
MYLERDKVIKKEKGFSLSELGIAMVIMLIISTIATMSYFIFIDNTKNVAVVKNAKTLQSSLIKQTVHEGVESYSVEANYETDIKTDVKKVLEYHVKNGTNIENLVFKNEVLKQDGELIIGQLKLDTSKSVAFKILDKVNDFIKPIIVNASSGELKIEVRKLDSNEVKKYIQGNVEDDWYVVSSVNVTDSNNCYVGYTCITTASELDAIRNDLSGNYMLMNDIDLNSYGEWNPIGKSIGFSGIFDGKKYSINGLSITDETTDNVGFFGKTTIGSEVKNVNLNNVKINGSINNVGGLVGYNDGTLINSSVTGNISGVENVGGLIGFNTLNGYIEKIHTETEVIGEFNVGGIVGWNDGGSVKDSFVSGNVTGDSFGGGLIGRNNGSIITSYANGKVSGTMITGGLVGRNGGIVTNSFWNVTTSGISTSDGGTGLTDSQMKNKTSFIGFNFDTVWSIEESVGYPTLK